MGNKWQQFLFCVIAQLLLPLLPLFIEFTLNGNISLLTWALTSGVYTISLGVTSNNLPLLAISIFISLYFFAIFGLITNNPSIILSVSVKTIAKFVLFIFSALIIIERFNRHIIKDEFFINFNKKKEDA